MIRSVCLSLSSGASRLYQRAREIDVKKTATRVAALAAIGAGVYFGAPAISAAVLACVNPEPVCNRLFIFPATCQTPETLCTTAMSVLMENKGTIGIAFGALLMSLQYLHNRTLQRRIQALEAQTVAAPQPGNIPPPPPVPAAPFSALPPAPPPVAPPVFSAAPLKSAAAPAKPKGTSNPSGSSSSAAKIKPPVNLQGELAAKLAKRKGEGKGDLNAALAAAFSNFRPHLVQDAEASDSSTEPLQFTAPSRKFSPPPAPSSSPSSASSASIPAPLSPKKPASSPSPVVPTAKPAPGGTVANMKAFWEQRKN